MFAGSRVYTANLSISGTGKHLNETGCGAGPTETLDSDLGKGAECEYRDESE